MKRDSFLLLSGWNIIQQYKQDFLQSCALAIHYYSLPLPQPKGMYPTQHLNHSLFEDYLFEKSFALLDKVDPSSIPVTKYISLLNNWKFYFFHIILLWENGTICTSVFLKIQKWKKYTKEGSSFIETIMFFYT